MERVMAEVTAAGLVGFLIFALIVVLVAYVIIYVLKLIPGAPAPAVQIATLIVGVIALIAILVRAANLFGVAV